MASYLVTGAAGFIASRVAELLLEDGHSVVGVDELNGAYDVRVKEWRRARLEAQPGFVFEASSICDRLAMHQLFHSHNRARRPPFDAVLNLAARVGVRYSVVDPWVYYDTNVTGTLNLLELCRDFEVPKFVLASTSSLYGACNPRPFREDANTDRPLSPYAASKKAAEALCHTYHQLYGLDVSILRYFTVYGPAGRPDMAPFRFVQWIHEERPLILYGDGSQERDFTFVDDIARGTVAGIGSVGYEVFNLGSDEPVRLSSFIELVERTVGRAAVIERQPVHPADMQATWANIDKAKRLLGWCPRTRLEEGVERMVAWYRENRDWARHVRTE